MVIIDSHTHMGTPMGHCLAEQGKWYGARQMLPAMDKLGIDKCLVFSTDRSTTQSFRERNDRINENLKIAKGRLIGVIRTNPWYGEEALQEIDLRIRRQGWKAIKLHPMAQGFPIDHPVVLPFFEKAKQLKVPIIVHSGVHTHCTPGAIAGMAAIYPEVDVILAHMGFVELCDSAVTMASKMENVYLDTTLVSELGYIRYAVEEAGPEKVLFGSDNPYTSWYTELHKLDECGLTGEQLRWVKGGSIEKLLRKVPKYD